MLVIWTHGLTVRRGGQFESMLERVRKEIQARVPDAHVEGCYWGDLGLRSFASLSVPKGGEGEMAIGDGTSSAPRLDELRAMLLLDWSLELRAMADAESFSLSNGGISFTPSNVAQRNALLLERRDDIAKDLGGELDALGVSTTPGTVDMRVREAIARACQADRQLTVGDLIEPLSRAITAAIGAEAAPLDDVEVTFDWLAVEDAVRTVLSKQLSGVMGLPSTLIKNAALHLATPALARMRPTILSRMATFIGDCFIYLKDAEPILKRLESTIAQHDSSGTEPIWLVGHSMGGIISFDYASRTDRPIDRLITVGSQVGLFAELDALLKLTKNGNGQPPFVKPAAVAQWINVYDRDDMLSFLAGTVFGGATDIHVDTGAPFPHSHSEYWDRPDLYDKICAGGARGK